MNTLRTENATIIEALNSMNLHDDVSAKGQMSYCLQLARTNAGFVKGDGWMRGAEFPDCGTTRETGAVNTGFRSALTARKLSAALDANRCWHWSSFLMMKITERVQTMKVILRYADAIARRTIAL